MNISHLSFPKFSKIVSLALSVVVAFSIFALPSPQKAHADGAGFTGSAVDINISEGIKGVDISLICTGEAEPVESSALATSDDDGNFEIGTDAIKTALSQTGCADGDQVSFRAKKDGYKGYDDLDFYTSEYSPIDFEGAEVDNMDEWVDATFGGAGDQNEFDLQIDLHYFFPEDPDSDGSEEAPYLVTSCQELQNINVVQDTDALYFKIPDDVDDIDCSMTNPADSDHDESDWGDEGFDPLVSADPDLGFNGVFDGNGKTISDLYINRPEEEDIGLFGTIGNRSDSFTGSVHDLTLEDVDITGGNNVGGLAGWAETSDEQSNIDVSGFVTGTSNTGGLIGYANIYTTGGLSSSATVSGDQNIGGLLGTVIGSSIEGSHATGDVTGASYIGGFAGQIDGASTIGTSYATGDVSGTGTGSFAVGGFAGLTVGDIQKGYAVGSVSGKDAVGGFAGSNDDGGNIQDAYARGAVTGRGTGVGGFAGTSAGTITSSYSTGTVSGEGEDSEFSNVGGFVGDNVNSLGSINYGFSVGTVTATDSYVQVGGFVGYNGNTVADSGYWTGAGSQIFVDGLNYSEDDADAFKNPDHEIYTSWTFDDDTWIFDTEGADEGGAFLNEGWPYLNALGTPVNPSVETPTYTLSFNTEGGTSVDDITDVEEDSSATLPAAPTRSGYTFEGWNTQEDGNGTSYAAGASFTMPSEDTVLYAIWNEMVADDSNDSPSHHRSGGGSVQSQVQNLIAMGKTTEAAAIAAQFPGAVGGTGGVIAAASAMPLRDLELGLTGEDIRALQKFLNQNGFIVSPSGAGAPGQETDFFGSLTRAALASYQTAKGITPAAGYFGPITRNQMKASGLLGLWW